MNTVKITALPTEEVLAARPSTFQDWLGITASIGCAIHCAAMPFVIAYLPALGLSFLADEAFHKWMALVCFLIALIAFIPGIRKHGNWIPVSIGAVGLFLITFAAFGLAGDCCPACAATNSASPNTSVPCGHSLEQENTSTTAVAGVASEEACRSCVECASCSQSNDRSETKLADQGEGNATASSSNDVEKSMLSTLAPWLTPFGGLLLVTAHLLNRRHGSLCGCC